MFNFMKKDKEKDPEEKERKKKEKREKKEAKKKEHLTTDELNRLEEAKKGLFGIGRKTSDKSGKYKSPYGQDVFGSKKRSSLPSLSGSESSISSGGKPRAQSQFYTNSDGNNGPVQLNNGQDVRHSKRGILKDKSSYGPTRPPNYGIQGDPDDSMAVACNTEVNENIGLLVINGVVNTEDTPPSIKIDEVEETSDDDKLAEFDEVAAEKAFDVDLHLPNIVPPKPPRSQGLVIHRTVKGDFGFSLRRAVIIERNPVDNRETPKNVIFAEPGVLGKNNHTGLLPGDRLVEVCGVNVEEKSRDEVIELIKEAGDTVSLTVQPVLELSELTLRPGWDARGDNREETLRIAGSLARTGSMRYKDKQAKSDAQLHEEQSWQEADNVWLVHKGGFTLASKVHTGGIPEGKVRILPVHHAETLDVDDEDVEKANLPSLDRVEDLVQLNYLNESSMLHTLRQRYGCNLVHTYAGPVMCIINPMHPLSVYSEKVIQMLKGCKREDMPPHIYATVQKAYHTMVTTHRDQSVIFMGRSGSGKTTNARHCLHYLAVAAGSVNKILTVEKLNAASTLLEAFGNSRTALNTNASRFTQVTSLDFDAAGQIASATVQVFMFEKSRVVRRPEGEPNFHIFYQLLAGSDSELRRELMIEDVSEHSSYMTPLTRPVITGPHNPHKVEDKQRAALAWARIASSLDILSIKPEEARAIWCVLAAVYHLGIAGAIVGVSSNKAQFNKPTAAQRAASLLGTTVEGLTRAIFQPGQSFSSRTDSFRSTLDRKLASSSSIAADVASLSPQEALDGFVVGLYTEAFNALLSLVNRSFSSNYRTTNCMIIVDSPGIQNPMTVGRKTGSSFEDLCHNYVQERFQFLFHENMFTNQVDRYVQVPGDENLVSSTNKTWPFTDKVVLLFRQQLLALVKELENIDFDFATTVPSPGPMISMIDKPVQSTLPRGQDGVERKGLLWLLDEEAIFPGATDETFVDRLLMAYASKKRKDGVLLKATKSPVEFIICHFHGTNPVLYNARNWLKLARENPLIRAAAPLLQESDKENISNVFLTQRGPIPNVLGGSCVGLEGSTSLRRVSSMRRSQTTGVAGTKRKSTALQVKFQMDGLVELLRKTTPHYVHCILPQHNAGLCDVKSAAQLQSATLDEIVMNVPLVREQIRSAELLDTLRIYRQGYPDHMPYGEFRRRFQLLAPPEARRMEEVGDEQAVVVELVQHMDVDPTDYKMGQTRIFFHAGVLVQLQAARDEQIEATMTKFQAYCRGCIARKKLAKRKVQDLAIRCVQRNVKKYMAIRKWDWWRLFTKVAPLLNVHRTEEELKTKEVELVELQANYAKLEKERNQLKQEHDRLESRLAEASADLTDEHATAMHASEMLEAETSERMRLEKELKEIQVKHASAMKKSQRLEMDVMELRMVRASVSSEDDDDDNDESIYKLRYERAVREIEVTRKRLEKEHEDEMEQVMLMKKQLERKLADAVQETEETSVQLHNWKRKANKLQTELEDVKHHHDTQSSRNNQLEKKQRKFDSELSRVQADLRDEHYKREVLQRERDEIEGEKYQLAQKLALLKEDYETASEKVARLQAEIAVIEGTTGKADDKELIKLKREKHELEKKVQDQEDELDDQAGQLQQVQQAKLRLEMENEKMRQNHVKEAETREQEMEELRANTSKKLKFMESELENESAEKQKLSREKRELESKLTDLAAVEPQRDSAREKGLKRDLRKTKALLRDAQTMLQQSREKESGRQFVKQLKNQLEDAEFAKIAAVKARQGVEMELTDLQHQLDDVIASKRHVEDKLTDITRERNELESKLEEEQEDMQDLMKKYKAATAKQSADQITLNEQSVLIESLQSECSLLREKVSEMSMKLNGVEETMIDKQQVFRLENRVKDLEGKLDVEQVAKKRLEANITRLKEVIERFQTEKENSRGTETRLSDDVKRLQKELRDLKEEHAELQRKECEATQRKNDLELALQNSEVITEQLQNDLKLAFKRIDDLHGALEDDLATDSDAVDYNSGDNSSESDIDDFLVKHNMSPVKRSRPRSTSSASSSTVASSSSAPSKTMHVLGDKKAAGDADESAC